MIPLLDGEKECRICKEIKPLSLFHKNKSCSQGVTGTCRVCSGKRIKSWYYKNRIIRQNIENKRNKKRQQEAVDYFGGVCFDCKLNYPNCVFEFHHLDPQQKDMNPSKALTLAKEKAWEELNKCVMLCANCHKIRHFGKEAINATIA